MSRDWPDPPDGFPLGASVTVADLARDPHPVLARLRAAEPVSRLPILGGWLVSRADLAERVLRDARTFTVDDPRFTTARVVGPSMLSLDGAEHRRHRDPFAGALRAADMTSRLAATAEREAARLVGALASRGAPAELRRGLAGPLAVSVMAQMLGLGVEHSRLLAWYDAIVAGVSVLAVADSIRASTGPGDTVRSDAAGAESEVARAASAAFAELTACVEAALRDGHEESMLTVLAGRLPASEIVSNAAVLLFGGIETTEGMICNAAWYLLRDAAALRQVRADRRLVDAAIEEALRLEPAAAVVDRFATADVLLGDAPIRRGDLVTVSLAGASRDPAVFPDPDRFDLYRGNGRQHLAFAIGPHFCLGAQLARQEASAALGALLDRLPGLRLDASRPSSPQGLVFRKPPTLHVRWDT